MLWNHLYAGKRYFGKAVQIIKKLTATDWLL